MYVSIHTHTGLEKGGFASPNVNYFWGNCESLWPTNSQYFLVTANHFGRLRITLANESAKRPFFDPHSILEKFYALRSNNENKLQIAAN